ncbi:cytochrome c oxidase assembly protein [Pseudohoeflea coraliihabitans]|uniref:Cytochrome c oxidase assembly protein n=1 Tax=Pseudohoeflea coraliihabitans TaxID=2860393 RepID=A0ABS6WM88_9HYPH|nr:cytochrome c oxidase assembly protein [Pseudohoeflea sp. DP4N28-3]MBW3097063.1 cytochrome c oxidase assembly protein [Pseudohoeflea sp. DP4N28-3]
MPGPSIRSLLAVAIAAGVWLSPLRSFGLEPFTIHMIRHMALIAIVAPLAAPAAVRLAERAGLAGSDRDAWPGGLLLAATVLEFLVVWGWHLPALHEWAAVSVSGFVLEQISFLLAGLLLWVSVLRAENGLAAAGGLLLTSMHMTLLGALLILAGRPLYAAICFGAAPLADQQMGGMLMLAIGTPIYLAAGVLLVRRELETSEEVQP